MFLICAGGFAAFTEGGGGEGAAYSTALFGNGGCR